MIGFVTLGRALSQNQDGCDRVIAYWSRQLTKAERNYSTIEREAPAIVGAVKEFYPYLYGFQFQLFTDHNPLTSLKTLRMLVDASLAGYYFSNNLILPSHTKKEQITLTQMRFLEDLLITTLQSLQLEHVFL